MATRRPTPSTTAGDTTGRRCGDILVSGATIQSYTLDTAATDHRGPRRGPGTSTTRSSTTSATGINVTGAEANSTVEYALNDGAYAASYDDIKGSITNGDTVNVRHTDLAGNVSSTFVTVTVDTTAPEMAGVADGSGQGRRLCGVHGHLRRAGVTGSIDLADFVFAGGDLTWSSVSATGTPEFDRRIHQGRHPV